MVNNALGDACAGMVCPRESTSGRPVPGHPAKPRSVTSGLVARHLSRCRRRRAGAVTRVPAVERSELSPLSPRWLVLNGEGVKLHRLGAALTLRPERGCELEGDGPLILLTAPLNTVVFQSC